MLLPIDIKPDKSLYYIGSSILKILNKESLGSIDVTILFDKYIKASKSNISFNYFLYALDWLYILNLIEVTKENKIKNVLR